jgi:vacuolar-type H+-ATPase subunit H
MANLSFGDIFPMNVDISSTMSNVSEKVKVSWNVTAEQAFNKVNEATTQFMSNVTYTLDQTENSLQNSLKETTERAVNSVSGIANQATNSLSEVANQVGSIAHEFSNNTINAVNGTAQKASSSVKNATNQVLNILSETGDKAKESVQKTLHSVGNFGNSITTKVDDSVSTAINRPLNGIKTWIDAHPIVAWITKVIAWGFHHPIIGIISLIVFIFLLKIFIKALSNFLEQAFLTLLNAPGNFSKLIFSLIFQPKNNVVDTQAKVIEQPEIPVPATSISPEHKERVTSILTRIEVIKHEQNELLQELKSLLLLDEVKVE